MNRTCDIDDCPHFARPHRRTCTSHRRTPAEPPMPSEVDLAEVEFVVRERCHAAGLNRGERIQVAARLNARQVPDTEIARLTGVTPRTVWRWLAADQQAA